MGEQSQSSELSRAKRAKALSFGERLRGERARLRLSQNEFAELGGVKRSSQYLYEHDMRSPDAAYLAKIQAGGTDVGYLFSGIQNLPAEGGVQLSVEQALAAFRAVENFAKESDIGGMSAPERERLFKLFCSTLAGDPTVDETSDFRAKAS